MPRQRNTTDGFSSDLKIIDLKLFRPRVDEHYFAFTLISITPPFACYFRAIAGAIAE